MSILFYPEYLAYNFGASHPFTPKRQTFLLRMAEAMGLSLDLLPSVPATYDELCWVHDKAFIDAVAGARGADDEALPRFGVGTDDVPFFPNMHHAAATVVGGTLEGARRILSGKDDRVLQLGGGLHHAQRDHASGFCVYNDLAVAISWMRLNGKRVAYLDIDAHHGDGVEALFQTDSEVMTISMHQDGRTLYPGTGFVEDLGRFGGRGYSLNVPLLPDTGDDSFLDCFERVVPHALTMFAPDVLVVQAGADAHGLDLLAQLNMSTHGFERLFTRIFEIARKHARGKLLVTLGGGYHPGSTLRVWLILLHLWQGKPLPEFLPEPLRSEMEAEFGLPISGTLHDPAGTTTPEDVMLANRTTSRRLMEMAAPLWW